MECKAILVVPLFSETDDSLLDLPRFSLDPSGDGDNSNKNNTIAQHLLRLRMNYHSNGDQQHVQEPTTMPDVVQTYIDQILLNHHNRHHGRKSNNNMTGPTGITSTFLVVTALHLLYSTSNNKQAQNIILQAKSEFSADDLDNAIDNGNDDDDSSEDYFQVAKACWEALGPSILLQMEWKAWIRLLRCVSKRFLLVNLVHPVHEYAQNEIPRLNKMEREQVKRILKLSDGGNGDVPAATSSAAASSSSSSVLRIMKEAQDMSPPRPWGILLDTHMTSECNINIVHSCFPLVDTTLLKSDKTSTSSCEGDDIVKFVAVYDSTSSLLKNDFDGQQQLCNTFSVDRLQCRVDSLEDRVRKIRNALFPTCLCDRCQYEMNGTSDNPLSSTSSWINDNNLSVERIIRLGHGYMALGEFNQAQKMYNHIVQHKAKEASRALYLADAWHALGAIELSRGRFLEAQRVWKSAKQQLRSNGDNNLCHSGLELQWTKLEGYGYFRDITAKASPPNIGSSTKVAENVFVTKLLDAKMCERVFDWASTGKWTKQRHYAVPTCDVPVHEVQPLLEWFNGFFFTTMRPLLARQFQTSPNYFTHDAFVVKYTAGEKSNHLPIHTDESTHSFVVALNDASEYKGGGTYLHQTDQIVRLRQGEILSFRGDSMLHGGEALESGTRKIVAVFLYHDDDDAIETKRVDQVSRKRSKSPIFVKSPSKEAKPSFSFDFQIHTTS